MVAVKTKRCRQCPGEVSITSPHAVCRRCRTKRERAAAERAESERQLAAAEAKLAARIALETAPPWVRLAAARG
jgi:hypothetical protein